MRINHNVQAVREKLAALQWIAEQRLAECVADPAGLPDLRGGQDEVAKAENIRRAVVADMALHRTTAEREAAVLELLRSYKDASWWTDMLSAGVGARGIRRLLDRRAERCLYEKRAKQGFDAPQSALPPAEVRFFVDSENVKPNHRNVWELLQKPNARIVLFLSENCGWPNDIDALNELLSNGATLETVNCVTGKKNAMDFQLIGMVGEYLARTPGGAAYIVSNDTGYDAAIKMWFSRGFAVARLAGGDSLPPDEAAPLGRIARFDRDALLRVAMNTLRWNGYLADEKERLANIMVKYALGELPSPLSRDIHGAIGHYMACGKRYVQIYNAERKNIETFLASAKSTCSVCRSGS